ncbi:hypothetical protein Tco_1043068 [Tanacetum coccineum]|uniref:Reverse transcriptase Ty1/copia-type domain-containing protein n=1 Tax=Tanacetum coccineum TaxID=301880 RepID=A0ABQ5GNK3_9ASTR
METQKPLLKDEEGKEVDVYMYRSMIGSLMYLTFSRPDIMFTVCVCARYQVNLKVSHLHAMKMIFSDYARASLDIMLEQAWMGSQQQEVVNSLDVDLYHGSARNRQWLQIPQHKLSMWLLQVAMDKCFGFRINYLIIDLLTKAFDVSRFQYLIVSIGMMNL